MKKHDYLLGSNVFYSKPRSKTKKFFVNFIFLLFAMFVLLFFLKITNGYFTIVVCISFFCIGCPVIILFSSQALLEEKNKIDIQKSHDLPIIFDRKKVIFGYIGTFFLFWFLPSAIFLLPDKAWMLAGPPIWLFSFAVIKLTEHTWIAFGWKKKNYWFFQILIYFILFLAALIFRCKMQY